MELELAVERLKRVHDYSKPATDSITADFQSLGDSPSDSPVKKITRKDKSDSITNATLLAAINKIGENQASFLQKLQCIEKWVNENTDAIRTLSTTVGDAKEQMSGLTANVKVMEQKISALSKENDVLRDRVNELDAYKRRWNLKISGVPERENENVKMSVVDLLSRVSPGIRDNLQNSVDVAHRLGRRIDNSSQPRRIIVQFIPRTHRDRVWMDAKKV